MIPAAPALVRHLSVAYGYARAAQNVITSKPLLAGSYLQGPATDTEATYRGLSSLEMIPTNDLKNLKSLRLYGSDRLGSGKLRSLKGLERATKLRKLRICNQDISALSEMHDLPELRILHLVSNRVTEVSQLQGLQKLTALYLSLNQISDVRLLKSLPSLKVLFLNLNPIRDIMPLAEIASLRALQVPLSVPAENIAEFVAVRPDVEVRV